MAPRPVIIDCDPGTDDAIALLLAFAAPEAIDLRAITVAGGNVGLAHTLRNALALTALAGARVPVHAGADRPLLGRYVSAEAVHGADGLGGIALPPGGAPAMGLAMDVIRAELRAADMPLTLVGIGPATNFALALASEPALAARIGEIVLMTGAAGAGNVTPAAEFNAWSDPEALAILLGCGAPVSLVTLELTAQARVTPARLAALSACGDGLCLRVACDILAASLAVGAHPAGVALHDPCAIAWLIAPGLFSAEGCVVGVDCAPLEMRGRTRIGPGEGAMLLRRLDADGFFALLGARLAMLV